MLAKLLKEGVRETQIKKISLSMVGTLALNSTSSCEVARPYHLWNSATMALHSLVCHRKFCDLAASILTAQGSSGYVP
jgi:hypothetical protein